MKTLVFTGGHHTSALVVADELIRRGWRVVWFGHRRSMWGDLADSGEYRDVTASGIPFYDLQAGKFYRTLNPLKLLRIPLGFAQAFVLLLRLRLELKSDLVGIVSFGGYLAVPTVITGWCLGIPAVTHEQTVVTGWANKTISLLSQKIAITWPASRAHFPASKVVLTGLPLRPGLLVRRSPRPPAPVSTIYITGGKQGSHALNTAVFSALPRLIPPYRLIHQTGTTTTTRDLSIAKSLVKKYPGKYRVFGFDSHMAIAALKKCQLVVSRAGAHTVYELAILGLPCVLVPLPQSSHHEQSRQAEILAGAGQAVIIPQDQLSPQSLIAAIAAAGKLHPRPVSLPTDGLNRMVYLIETTFR